MWSQFLTPTSRISDRAYVPLAVVRLPFKVAGKSGAPLQIPAEDGRSGYIRQTFEVSNIEG